MARWQLAKASASLDAVSGVMWRQCETPSESIALVKQFLPHSLSMVPSWAANLLSLASDSA